MPRRERLPVGAVSRVCEKCGKHFLSTLAGPGRLPESAWEDRDGVGKVVRPDTVRLRSNPRQGNGKNPCRSHPDTYAKVRPLRAQVLRTPRNFRLKALPGGSRRLRRLLLSSLLGSHTRSPARSCTEMPIPRSRFNADQRRSHGHRRPLQTSVLRRA